MTKYYALLTNLGAAKLANAAALGTKLQITHMAVGDGGGTLPTPNASQTALVAEKRRAALNALSVDAANSSQIIAEQIIPETDGGFWIREIGLFDTDGVMIAVANCPETYKPQLQEGSGRTQTVRMILIVNSTEAVTLKIDPSVVLATRKYVDDRVIEVKAYADSLMAQHLAAADPHPQYAPKASPALTGKPTAPTAAKTDSSTQLATTAFVKGVAADYAPLTSPALNGTPTAPTPGQAVNSTQIATTAFTQALVAALNTTLTNALALKAPLASPALSGTPTAPTAVQTTNNTQLATTAFVKAALAGLVDSSPAALDTLKELATALGNDPNFATTMTNALAGKLAIGDFGIGATSAPNGDNNANTMLTGGIYAPPGVNGVNYFDAYSPLLVMARYPTNVTQLQVTAAGKIAVRGKYNDVWSDWVEMASVGSDLPVGVPQPWPLATPPAGWGNCAGQSFSKTLYPKLGAVYPSGVLPDLRGEFIRGWDNGRGVNSGRGLLSAEAGSIESHGHVFSRQWGSTSADPTGGPYPVGADANGSILNVNTISTDYTGGNETRPRNIAFNYIVRLV